MIDLALEIRALKETVQDLQVKQEYPDLMSPAQCAQYLGRSEDTLFAWRRDRLCGCAQCGFSGIHYQRLTKRRRRRGTLQTPILDSANRIHWHKML